MHKFKIGSVLAVGAAGVMLSIYQLAFAVPQPHMDSTLRALEEARHEIEIADQYNDHGGHAGQATKLIDQAIHEVKEGMRFKDEHP